MPSENGYEQNYAPTSGKELRRPYEEGLLVQLPSGTKVFIRPFTNMFLLEHNLVPDVLLPIVQEIALGKRSEIPADDWQMIMGINDLTKAICRAVFVNPRIVDDPQDDNETRIEAIEEADRNWVFFELVNRPARDLERFHPRYHAGVESVATEPDHLPSAEPDHAHRSVGKRKIRDKRLVDGAAI